MLWEYLCHMGAQKDFKKIKNVIHTDTYFMCTAVPMSH